MLTNRIAVGLLACSCTGVFSGPVLFSQYPNFNNGQVINNDTSGGPTRMAIGTNTGQVLVENGASPGAQVTLILVQGTASWTQGQADALVSAVSTGLQQGWPGPPYVAYPAPTYQTTDNTPQVDQSTGWQGA
jgi:hypothetical protein